MLKIDLLPRQIAIARRNKILVALIIVLLLVEVAALGVMLMDVKGQQQEVDEEFAKTKEIADEVRSLESETQSKQGDLDPIQAKIDFIEDANESGEAYWDRFHAINEYIYSKAQMTRFSITGGSQVNFTVIVSDTTEAARFVLNLVHSPALSNVSVAGLPAGVSIEGAGGGGGGGFQPMGGPEMGMEPGMEMGMEPGMGGAMGPGPGMGGAAPQASDTGDITLDVTATLTEPIQEPAPTGGGAAAAMGGGMGAGGMGGPPGMEPGGMGPGGMEPGAGPGPGGGPPGAEPGMEPGMEGEEDPAAAPE